MQGDEILAEISGPDGINRTYDAAPRHAELIPAVRISGRFMAAGQQKASIRGVTYGPFAEIGSGREFGNRSRVLRDFEQMRAANVNSIRTYTLPPLWLLDAAERSGLRVMVGIPWEQHVTFLDDANQTQSIIRRVRDGVRSCERHPAVLCYAIGNEIPASIVRWHGAYRVERFLRELCDQAREEDADGLFTYVNYPSTEYLQLPFLDLVCFNVYLEGRERLADYLARLLNLAGDRPLVMGEIGLDSQRNGELRQARLLEEQIETVFDTGCAGAFVFSWTDEWHRGGCEITDWDFGLTRRDGTSKPSLSAVRNAFGAGKRSGEGTPWPRVSVVVCTYNGQRFLTETLSALAQIDYPDYEVIVVDDGSTDATPAIAGQYDVRLIRTENHGLSSARNTGLRAATGEIVAYIDDDAYPDTEWLKHLAKVFLTSSYVGVGGPNLPPAEDPLVAQCVAHAPGGPIHVLLSDREAEHIPGCNMAFRREQLLAIGGFDPQFRVAGDDVDVCWRVQEQGWKLGFSPMATVFHHRRDSVRAYWKQQLGYGKAEALLERKWPGKYNAVGHLSWGGQVYNARGLTPLWWRRGRIYQGTWGMAPYQRLYQPASTLMGELPLLPEWYLIIAFFATLSLIGVFWKPLLAVIPFLLIAAGLSILLAAINAVAASSCGVAERKGRNWRALLIGLLLHILQPLARLCGRLKYGLHPWRRRGATRPEMPRSRTVSLWSELWRSPDEWLRLLQERMRCEGTPGVAGGDYDNWDLEIQSGVLGGLRTRMAVEEHGSGKQLLRFRIWPRCSLSGLFTSVLMLCLAVAAGYDRARTAAFALGGVGLLVGWRMFLECALAMHQLKSALSSLQTQEGDGTPQSAAPHQPATVAMNSYPATGS